MPSQFSCCAARLLRAGLLLVVFCTLVPSGWAAELQLKKGDHICLVGNALGERLQHQNY